jgi:putative oxidoreductase
MFLAWGATSLEAPAAAQRLILGAGVPGLESAYWVVSLVELVAGAALAIGFRVRVAAAGLALLAGFAAVTVHARFGEPDHVRHFIENLAIAGGLLQIVALGSGGFTLDALLRRGVGRSRAGRS